VIKPVGFVGSACKEKTDYGIDAILPPVISDWYDVLPYQYYHSNLAGWLGMKLL
jgi:hypothetical protein